MQYSFSNQAVISQSERWRQVWPTPFLALIAVGQMLLTGAIVALETWSMLLNITSSFLFVGYITSFFFTITWISTFTVVCCNRESRCCATHALVENVLSIIASSVLLYYDTQFLRYPTACFWSFELCIFSPISVAWHVFSGYNIFDLREAKLIAIRAQLACAAIMLSLSVFFFIIYIYTVLKVESKQTSVAPYRDMELRQLQQQQQPTIYTVSVQ
ncbi:unnamed protein product [Rotaria socialis]|uniref:MARVEL domain-containing protein n=1 Tax=Rotaria socialis TaxID=392032 RepID=A0A818P049_9BILA|nr:unnamed protein product [Rotaria socialis]CAF3612986.1 unnamed protein product [Rotaria socialis]CAF4299495.1 unnamed protein product [Rotaria socialis]CAF4522857.1 unnamed protein product [Rotaria socialis]